MNRPAARPQRRFAPRGEGANAPATSGTVSRARINETTNDDDSDDDDDGGNDVDDDYDDNDNDDVGLAGARSPEVRSAQGWAADRPGSRNSPPGRSRNTRGHGIIAGQPWVHSRPRTG